MKQIISSGFPSRDFGYVIISGNLSIDRTVRGHLRDRHSASEVEIAWGTNRKRTQQTDSF